MNTLRHISRYILLISLTYIGFQGCAFDLPVESSLSDTDISNPGLFSLEALLHIDNSHSYIDVILEDKNDDYIRLKTGDITINNIPLTVVERSGAPHYQLSLSFEPQTEYIVTVTLADGKEYHSSITTPDFNYTMLTTPTTHTRNTPLTISWASTIKDPSAQYSFHVSRYYTQNKRYAYRSSYIDIYSTPNDTTTTFDNSIFNDADTGYPLTSLTLSFSSSKSGSIHPTFAGGSIRSKFKTSKTITITDK